MLPVDLGLVRSRVPALSNCTYLNCGTFGPIPTPVADEVVRLVRLTEAEGPYTPHVFDLVKEVYEQARQEAASLLNAQPQEIALTRNVSDGINIVATGFDWQPGDEVVITSEEHPSGALPWMNLMRRRGVVVRPLALCPEPDEFLQRLERLLSPRTRLVFLSHVSTRRGIRIPAAKACQLVHGRGIPIMLDGAHAAGAVSVDVEALGCDFYAGCAHKWLLAPQGTGFLYVKRDRLEELQLTWLGWGMTEEYDLPGLSFKPVPEARRLEYGTRSWSLYGGMAVALRLARELGMDNIQARGQMLASRLKQRLSDIPGIEVQTPLEPERSAGLVAISTAGLAHASPGQWLWEKRRILVAHNPDQKWMRLSAAYFLLEEEIDRVADCLASLASSRPDM